MKKLKLNKSVNINVGDLAHGGLSNLEVIKHYQENASPAGFLMEKILPKHFSNVHYSKERVKIGHITICPDGNMDINNGNKIYDQKTVTKKGVNWKRSRSKGAGRQADLEIDHKLWQESQIFIFTDISNLPIVKVIARDGAYLYTHFNKHNVSKKTKEKLFE